MRIEHFTRIGKEINDCPNCGDDRIGTNAQGEFQGGLLLENDRVTRTCKCGFEITIDSRDGVTKKVLRAQIDAALAQFRGRS